MDKTALLVEMNEILGYKEKAKKMEAAAPRPRDVAARFQQPGNTLVDDAVLESLGLLEWGDLLKIAAFGNYPPESVIELNRSLSEGTAAFRAAWSGFAREFEVPEELGRGAFLMMNKISPDDSVLTRLVSWSSKMVNEADSRVRAKLEKENPGLAEEVFAPAGDEKRQEKETAETEKYMTPYKSQTDRPDDAKRVMKTRMFSDPAKEKTKQKKELKSIDDQIENLTKVAEKAGTTIDQMFPMLYRDLMRERARHS